MTTPQILGWAKRLSNGGIGNFLYTCEEHCDVAVRDDGGEKIAVVAAKQLADANHKLAQYKAAFDEWHEKTEWVQETSHWSELGMHRADVLKMRIEALEGDMTIAKKAARLVALRECRDMFVFGSVAYKALDEKLVAEIDKPVEL